MSQTLWNKCLTQLELELSTQQYNTWIRPLKAESSENGIVITAPNRFVLDWVNRKFLYRIKEISSAVHGEDSLITLQIKKMSNDLPALSSDPKPKTEKITTPKQIGNRAKIAKPHRQESIPNVIQQSSLNPLYNFENYVEGKSNQLARAASFQVAENPGGGYNPLFLYGGVGLGKTHLMHAIGNYFIKTNPKAKVAYLHSEKFVQDMVKALQHNSISRFKNYYRSLNVLLIDDIQFFAGKERSQEEFFHTFNQLLEGQNQVVLTCDRYPKEVDGLEERLKSRFGWGLTVSVEPPDLETRIAILMSKAKQIDVVLTDDVAFFLAKNIRSNIRDLEGALRRVSANSRFTGNPITLDFTREALKDLLAVQQKLVTLENIQKTVTEYYKIRFSELLSKKRTRSIARPRQIAMTLAKELTNHSLPEIGNAFGGRDHTTVIHACKKVNELKKSDIKVEEDYSNLLRRLTT